MHTQILELIELPAGFPRYTIRKLGSINNHEKNDYVIIIKSRINGEIINGGLYLEIRDVREFINVIRTFENNEDLSEWRVVYGTSKTKRNRDEKTLRLTENEECIICEKTNHDSTYGLQLGENVFIHEGECLNKFIEKLEKVVKESDIFVDKL